ncbi:restriction endonuclease subunit S [Petrimonas sp.]|uniref:restriction endonuclease subunit S n=1 Tax=Petrimonas sp. TaxID=2023866 RepID=UPI003F51AB6C
MNKEKWEIKKLGEIAIVSSGQSAPQNKSYFGSIGIPFVRAGNLEELINGSNEQNLLKIKKDIADKYKLKQYPKGSVLFAKSGMSAQLNRIHVLKTDCYIVSHIAILQLKKELPTYIKYYLRYNPPSNLIKDEGYPSISLSDIQSLKIPIPPLSTQEKIVSELDSLHRLKELHEQQLAEYDNLAQSTFYSMFGDPIENEKGWEVKKLGEVAPVKSYKGEVERINEKYWLLNLDVVEQQSGEVTSYNYVQEKDINQSTVAFNEDNVLYSKLRPYLNKVVIPYKSGYCTSELLPLLPQKELLKRAFLTSLLRSYPFVEYIKEKTNGAKMPRVNMDEFRSFNLILPPLSLQTQFSERIERIDAQKELIKQSIGETQLLIDYTMDKYFG